MPADAPTPDNASDRLQRGAALLARIHGRVGAGVLTDVASVSPDLARIIAEFAFGDIYSRPGLDLRSRQIATIAALTVLGHESELEAHIGGGLNVGLAREEIVEVILQMALYGGFPAAIGGMKAARKVFTDRDGQGPELAEGEVAKP